MALCKKSHISHSNLKRAQKRAVSDSSGASAAVTQPREPFVDRIADFRNLHLFKGCSAAEIEKYLKSFDAVIKSSKKGDVIISESMKGKWMMVVLKGSYVLYDHMATDVDSLVRVFESGGFLGMSLSMKSDVNYPCMLLAGSSGSEILMLDNDKIREHWCKPGYEKFFTNLMDCFTEYVWFCRSKFAILKLRDAEDRILLCLRQRAKDLGTNEFQMQFSSFRVMAEYLGITRTSMSRSIANLEKDGKIRHLGKGRFVVCSF